MIKKGKSFFASNPPPPPPSLGQLHPGVAIQLVTCRLLRPEAAQAEPPHKLQFPEGQEVGPVADRKTPASSASASELAPHSCKAPTHEEQKIKQETRGEEAGNQNQHEAERAERGRGGLGWEESGE